MNAPPHARADHASARTSGELVLHALEVSKDYGHRPVLGAVSFRLHAGQRLALTGHLYGEADRRFGFQATFFRRAGPRSPNDNVFTSTPTLFDQGAAVDRKAVDFEMFGRQVLW
jgi:hypothetical protein